MSTLADDDPLLRRTIAGKYVITSFIGDGAMGAIYRARHVALDTSVAVKVVKTQAPIAAFAERFRREAQAASRLDHPNSVRVIDYGEEPDGLLYLVMELLDGRELRDVIEDEQPLSPARVVSIMSQALAAIAVAHDQGVVHRDLKPENIMILRRADDDGAAIDVVKVCDFGIAKLQYEERAERRRLTTQGEVIGTPEFMSPEQARGEELDARSDLYSMGVILFEMLTGRPPFESDTTLGLALKHVTDTPPAPSSVQPTIDPELERVCLKALAKRREDRHQTAREMRLELRAAIDATGESVSLRAAAPFGPRATPAGVSLPATTLKTGHHAETLTEAVVGAHPPSDRRRRGVYVSVGAVLIAGLAGVMFARVARERVTATPPSVSVTPATALESAPTIESPLATAPAPSEPRSTAPSEPASTAPAPTSTAPAPTSTAPAPTSTAAKAIAHPTAPHAEGTATSPSAPAATTSAPEPAPTPTPVVVAVPATSPPAATPTVAPASVAAPAPPFDPAGARAVIASAAATNGVSGSSVRSSLNVDAISRCYRDALKAKGAPASGTATLQLSIDDGGRVTSASLKGAEFLPGLRGCVEGVARLARIKGVDTGDAVATVALSFTAK
ncbi:MAG: protein kinase [Deltaproteobacteria bacterium]|nr:protein kinase [Deltaproteobacteria bacterium]